MTKYTVVFTVAEGETHTVWVQSDRPQGAFERAMREMDDKRLPEDAEVRFVAMFEGHHEDVSEEVL